MAPEFLILFTVVFAVNLLPAFGPPTWSIIVLYGLNSDLPLAPAVLAGAAAAASGRLVLAVAFRALGKKAPAKIRQNLKSAKAAFESKKRAGIMALALFAVSPVPSAQLFEAAGLTNIRLLPFTLAFFAGRLASYAIYAHAARALKESSLGGTLASQLSSPAAIAVQVLMLGSLVLITQINWSRFVGNGK